MGLNLLDTKSVSHVLKDRDRTYCRYLGLRHLALPNSGCTGRIMSLNLLHTKSAKPV